jgi:hypothetical protein
MTIAITALQITSRCFLKFYNRDIQWGALIWQGDNNTSDWDGYANKELFDNQNAPTELIITLLN